MARWEANPRERLGQAALELFAERGYDTTTVADIAERAGLTKSTFFRHFDDKRAVLFGGQDDMVNLAAESVTAAPAGTPPLACAVAAVRAFGRFFPPERRAWVAARSPVIAAHPELRERELLKAAQLTTAIRDALRGRGVDDVTARFSATTGMLAFELAYERWAASTGTFDDHVTTAVAELTDRAAAAGRRPSPYGRPTARPRP
jgi:AcrR family transcriptional regulator